MTELEIKQNFSKNITLLRKQNKMTQQQLAEKLNYSYQAVSKWERGEALCDLVIISKIADIFGTSVDFLINDNSTQKQIKISKSISKIRKQCVISVLSCGLSVLIATLVFSALTIWCSHPLNWLCFISAISVCSIIMIVFSAIWFSPSAEFVSISILIWSVALLLFIPLMHINYMWLVFVCAGGFELMTIFAFILYAVIKYQKQIKQQNDNK